MRKHITNLFIALIGTFIFYGNSYGATTPITLGASETIATGIARAGSVTDVTVTIPDTYTGSTTATTNDLTAISSTITDLTIQGASSTTKLYLKQINLPARTLNSFKLKSLDISGVNEATATVTPYNLLTYVLSPSNASNVTNLTFESCKVENFRGIVRLNNSTASTYNNIRFDGCDIRSIADFNMVYLSGSNVVNTVTLVNSNIYAQAGRLLYLAPTTNPTSVSIDHCTIDNYGAASASYFVEYASTNSTTTTAVTNCIFARTTSTYGIRYGATPTYSNNYKTTDWASGNPLTATSTSSTAAALFNSPVTVNVIPSSTITCSINATTTVTLGTASSNVYVGQSISGTGIPSNTTISTKTGSPVTSVTISAAATATNASASLTFGIGISTNVGDYTIKDANFAGKSSAGNPSCYYPISVTVLGSPLTGLSYNLNNGPSPSQSFTVSAIALRGIITITGSTDYEVSTDNTNFSGSVTVGTAGSDLSSTPIYVRLKSGLSVASYNSEQISIATSGATTQYVSCSGSVTNASATPLAIPTNLQASSVTYTGFHASWTGDANASSYTLVVYQNGSAVKTTSGISGTSADITGLTPGTTYTFTVTSIGDGSTYSSSSPSAASSAFSTTTLYLYTSVNTAGAGTVSPAAPTTYSSTSATVQLTATKNFGYAFTQWNDSVTGTQLSTANPYTVTMSATKHIQAVFTSVATPNFTVNLTGTGATWGSVTSSVAATNGKYEQNTQVTLTPVSNLVSTFSNWVGTAPTSPVTVGSSDLAYTANFTASPFIVGWDVNATGNIRNNRTADFYYNSANKGVLRLYETNGSTTSWTNNTVGSKTCARRWTTQADIQTNMLCRYFRVELSTKGYKTIQLASKIAYDNNQVNKIQKLQFSTDGTSYSDLSSVDFTGKTASTWYALNATLPSTADNASIIYLKWIGDVNSGTMSSATAGTSEGFYLTDIIVSGTPISSDAVSGDYVATTSGDINAAANYSVSGGSFGISGTAASAPTAATNVIIPAGITMTNSASATCNQLKVRGTYSASAAMNVAGGIVIQSDSTGTGAILDNGNTITGSATVNQYLTGITGSIPRGWWYVSSPVSNATAAVFIPNGSTNKFGYWNETTCTYPQITDNTTLLNAGQGYVFYNPGADATISFTGTLNTGDITVDVTRTGTSNGARGFNLIGNPYPSYVNWNAATKTNVRNTIWYRTWTKGGTMQFDTYDGSTGTSNGMRGAVSQYIPPMQGFWVKVDADPVSPATTSAGSIVFHNADRLYKDQTLQTNRLRTKANADIIPGIVRLRVSNGTNADETILVADANASDAADSYDSPKMKNYNVEIPEIYTVAGSEEMVINHLNNFSPGKALTLGFRPGKVSDFTIVATEITNIDNNLKVVLQDNATNLEYDLTDGSAYTFSSSDAISTTTRFTVLFKSADVVNKLNNELLKINVYCNAQNQIAVDMNAVSGNGSVAVYNSIGQKLVDKELTYAKLVIDNHLKAGVYAVELNVNGQRLIKKVVLK